MMAAALALPVPLTHCVGQSPEQGVYVAVLGTDTIVVERVRRTADSLSGDVAVRAPGSGALSRIEYAASLAPQGLVHELVVAMPSEEDGQRRTTWVRMGSDSSGAYAATMRGTDPGTSERHATGPAAVPTISVSLGLLEQVLRRARNIPGDSVAVPVFLVDQGRAMQSVARFAGDSVELATDTERMHLQTDGAGRILGGGDSARGLRILRAAAPPSGWLTPE